MLFWYCAPLTILLELNMDQIIPMEDEETGDELRVISASFADPYLLILREDSSVKVFKASDSGEVEEMEGNGFSNSKWLTASLYRPTGFSEIFALLLMPEGGLQVTPPPFPKHSQRLTRGRFLQCQTLTSRAILRQA